MNDRNAVDGEIKAITRVTLSGARPTGRCDVCGGYTGMDVGPHYRDNRFDRALLCSCVEWDLRTDFDKGRAEGERAATERIVAWLEQKAALEGPGTWRTVIVNAAAGIKRGQHNFTQGDPEATDGE